MKKTNVLLPLFLFLIMLVDGQLTTLLINALPSYLKVSSHLLLLSLIFLANQNKEKSLVNILVFAIIGLVYDSYYLGLIGMAATLLPIFVSVLEELFKTIRFNWFNVILINLILVFTFDSLAYFLGYLLDLNHLRFDIFMVEHLAPSLFYNFLQTLVIYPIFLNILKKTRHTIVKNA